MAKKQFYVYNNYTRINFVPSWYNWNRTLRGSSVGPVLGLFFNGHQFESPLEVCPVVNFKVLWD